MKRIAYGETVVTTDGRLADLVLEYATLLARTGTADTVTIPGIVGDGDVEPVSMLVGPASQLTAWEEHGVFDADVTAEAQELERRIGAMSTEVPVDPTAPPLGFDDFDEPGGTTG